MNFVINSTVNNGMTVTANVTYTLTNGYEETVDVAIFQPQTFADIVNGVHSRGLTIQSRKG